MSSFHNHNVMSHLSLQQQQQQQWASEAVPLNQQQQQQHRQRQEGYSTFQQQQQQQQHRHTESEGSKWSRPWYCLFFLVERREPKRQKEIKSLTFVLVLLVGLYMGHSSNQTRQQQQQHENEIMTLPHHTGTWIWDYNVYHNNYNASSASQVHGSNNNLLLTQIAGCRSLQELSDISSLPNRAYARQWRRDYVQIICASSSSSSATATTTTNRKQEEKLWLEKSCLTKIFVLQWLLEKHNNNNNATTVVVDTVKNSSSSNGDNKATTTTRTIPYDTVALLPPDAIVTDLDYDLQQLLPPDKLVAIAGYWQADNDDDNGKSILAASTAALTDIVFFNLRHKHAAQVIQLWSDAIVTPKHVSCGAGNDLQLLFEVMRSVVQDDEDEFQSMIHGLIQTEQGFIIGGNNNKNQDNNSKSNNNRVIKSITPQLPACRLSLMLADMANSRAVLQTTADSVCYRYYPKCELL